MKRVSLSRSALAALVIAAAALLAFGCSKKLTVDPTYSPEGVLNANARLILYPDAGVLVQAKHEFPPNSGLFLLDSSFTVYSVSPGTVLGAIVDGTNASGFEIMRKTSSGGFSPIKDFTLTPAKRWLYSHWDAFTFHDDSTAGMLPPTYEGRGVVSGQVTTSSPLTNTAVLSSTPVANIQLLVPEASPAQGGAVTARHDSLPTITWSAVPGAASYYIHCYQFRGDIRVGAEKFPYGTPAPIAFGKVRDFFIAIVPGGTTTYKLGGPGAQVLLNTPMIGPDRFFFRITAVNDSGQLIGCTAGVSPDTVRVGTEAFVYSKSAEQVCLGCGGH